MNYFEIVERPHYLICKFHASDSANAFSLAVARELSDLQKKYRRNLKPIVFRSAHPRLFCSGGNLSDYQKLKSRAAGLKVNREIKMHLQRFGAWPVMKLAVIEGDVLGGGMEWLAHFDERWGTSSALLSFWQRRIGLSPGWGGGVRWASLLGGERIRRLLTAAEILSGARARELGILDRLVVPWQIEGAVDRWAQDIDESTVRAVRGWTAKGEAKLFARLWLNTSHRTALNGWDA